MDTNEITRLLIDVSRRQPSPRSLPALAFRYIYCSGRQAVLVARCLVSGLPAGSPGLSTRLYRLGSRIAFVAAHECLAGMPRSGELQRLRRYSRQVARIEAELHRLSAFGHLGAVEAYRRTLVAFARSLDAARTLCSRVPGGELRGCLAESIVIAAATQADQLMRLFWRLRRSLDSTAVDYLVKQVCGSVQEGMENLTEVVFEAIDDESGLGPQACSLDPETDPNLLLMSCEPGDIHRVLDAARPLRSVIVDQPGPATFLAPLAGNPYFIEAAAATPALVTEAFA